MVFGERDIYSTTCESDGFCSTLEFSFNRVHLCYGSQVVCSNVACKLLNYSEVVPKSVTQAILSQSLLWVAQIQLTVASPSDISLQLRFGTRTCLKPWPFIVSLDNTLPSASISIHRDFIMNVLVLLLKSRLVKLRLHYYLFRFAFASFLNIQVEACYFPRPG